MNQLLVAISLACTAFIMSSSEGICANDFSKDVLVLANGSMHQGSVERVHTCAIQFSVGEFTYDIPACDIAEVHFSNPESRAARKMAEILEDADACFTGQTDAQHHGHGVGHFASGLFFGAFGVIGCAVTKRTPYKSNNPELITVNQSMWSDPAYLACYNKSARSKAVSTSALGWLTWVLFLIV